MVVLFDYNEIMSIVVNKGVFRGLAKTDSAT